MSTCPCSTDIRVRSTVSPVGFSYLRARDIYFLISVHLFYPPQCLISSVQFSRSVGSDSLRPHEVQHARLPCPSKTPRAYSNSCLESVMPSNHLILCHLLLLPPSVFPRIRVFSKESVLRMRWPKYWSFSFSISPSNEHPGLIALRMDWLDLLAVQGTLKIFSNTTVQKHQFFDAQVSL